MLDKILDSLKINYTQVGDNQYVFIYSTQETVVYCVLSQANNFISISLSTEIKTDLKQNLINECNDYNKTYLLPKMYVSENSKIYADCNIVQFDSILESSLTTRIDEFLRLSLHLLFHIAKNQTFKDS